MHVAHKDVSMVIGTVVFIYILQWALFHLNRKATLGEFQQLVISDMSTAVLCHSTSLRLFAVGSASAVFFMISAALCRLHFTTPVTDCAVTNPSKPNRRWERELTECRKHIQSDSIEVFVLLYLKSASLLLLHFTENVVLSTLQSQTLYWGFCTVLGSFTPCRQSIVTVLYNLPSVAECRLGCIKVSAAVIPG